MYNCSNLLCCFDYHSPCGRARQTQRRIFTHETLQPPSFPSTGTAHVCSGLRTFVKHCHCRLRRHESAVGWRRDQQHRPAPGSACWVAAQELQQRTSHLELLPRSWYLRQGPLLRNSLIYLSCSRHWLCVAVRYDMKAVPPLLPHCGPQGQLLPTPFQLSLRHTHLTHLMQLLCLVYTYRRPTSFTVLTKPYCSFLHQTEAEAPHLGKFRTSYALIPRT